MPPESRISQVLLTAHPCQAISFVGGVAWRPHRCRAASHRLIGFCYLDSAEILCPMGAARFDQGARFGIGSICGKDGGLATLLAIAPPAQAHKVFCYHSAAFRLGNDVATFIGIPRSASGAASKTGKGSSFDCGGDGGFLGHDSGPFLGFP